jgi:membrane protein required for colicin V production
MITGLDFILVAFMLLSALLAMVRGLAREVLSIVSWAAAAIGAIVLFPRLRGFAREQLTPEWLADIVLIGGTFLIILILVSFITIRISDMILDSRIGALDRSLGFVFGLARGFLLVVIAILFVNWYTGPERQPSWIADARSKSMLDNAGDYLIGLLPDDPDGALFDSLKDRIRQNDQAAETAPAADETRTADRGYRSGERQGLDQLLESTEAAGQ